MKTEQQIREYKMQIEKELEYQLDQKERAENAMKAGYHHSNAYTLSKDLELIEWVLKD